jgi:hypothetical protein
MELSLASKETTSREIMEQVVVRAVLEAVQAMRKANSTDNMLLRELKALHSNTTMEDLPEHLQKLVKELATSMFGYINRSGFVLVPRDKKR